MEGIKGQKKNVHFARYFDKFEIVKYKRLIDNLFFRNWQSARISTDYAYSKGKQMA